MKEYSDIDHSKYHHSVPPNPTYLNFNENPEDKKDLVNYEEATDNEMNDQGLSNKQLIRKDLVLTIFLKQVLIQI